ncbi:hypothetical protein [Pseudonocardia sp. ICBG1142]|uniref:hypothetical protein n=1 Tax=Pseudonocardia sp. ICBG1142 TaxID=2846760 RepID=UPI001CF63962|nr:hypothetical protein [Pseudonocardia sp. ICBG1142]
MDVAPGCCAIVGDDVSDQGTYLCRSTTPINVAVPPKPASGQREHLLVARVRDSLANGVYAPAYEWSIELLEDPGSGRPELPGSAIELATVTVSADAVSVTAAAISDLRQRSVVGTPALSGDMYASGMHPAYGGRDSTRPLTWMKNPDGWVVLSGWVRRTGGNYTMRANQTAWFDGNTNAALLPVDARPTGIRDFIGLTANGPAHYAVHPSGRVSFRFPYETTLTQNATWFSFDGCMFRANSF